MHHYPRHSLPLALLASLLLAPALSWAQSILLTADDFVVLAGTAVSIGGAGPTTLSNGNVGAAASISGIPPATIVNGSAITGGVIVGQALNDLITARNALSALASPPANNLSGVNGGNLATQILAPGVYTFNTAASISLNGVLTLDAQGQNNVTWVINIGTELTTGANAEVQFINLGSNGGADNGLFWNAGSSITFGGDNIIAGNYLAGTSIAFGTTLPANGSAGGRALALAGVSFAGAGTLDVLGGPGNGDMTGGLILNNGQLVASGYVLLSANGAYLAGTTPLPVGVTRVKLAPGTLFNTANVTIDGNSSDSGLTPASLTVFRTNATVTGTNTYTGGTVVDSGTLTTGSANLPAGGNVSLIDSNTSGTSGVLIFDQDTNGTFTGVISGTGSVTKQGTGTLVLTNTHTYTGGTSLNEGALALNGATIGTTTVANGAFLRGNGIINGNLFNGGTVSPGFSPGTIVVVGNFTQTSVGTLTIELASPVSFDRLLVGGIATLDGTLQLVSLNGYDPANDSFAFLTATGGVTGSFSTVISPSAALTPVVTVNANDVTLTFTQTSFTTFAGTPNQIANANAGQANPGITAALNTVPTAGQLTQALNAISPQGYEIWSDIAFARAVSLTDRLSHIYGATPGHDNYYFQAGQSRNKSAGDANVGSTDFNSDSGLVGGDHALSESFTIGAFLEYTETDSGLGSIGSRSEVKSVLPGIRATWNQDAWFANAAVAYGFDHYKSTRQINFSGTSATASSKTDGRQWIADISGGRHFDAGVVSLSPFAGLLASGWKADGFTETGAGAFNATVDDQNAHSLRTQLGLEAALNLNIGSVGLRPHVRATWLHELTNDSRPISGSFSGSAFTIETRKADRDTFRLGAGLEALLTPTLSLYVDYAAQTGNTTSVTGEWNGGLSMRF
jgi:autotransporter-associated beta strand protein